MSRRICLLLAIAFIAASLQPLACADDACCPPTDSSTGWVSYEELVYFQGDDPRTAEVEPRDVVHVVDKTLWVLPWNASRIYVPVPQGAVNVTIDNVEPYQFVTGTTFLPGRYSWAENAENPPLWNRSTDYPDFFYWQFPSGVDRNYTHMVLSDTTEDLSIFDAENTDVDDWNVTGGTLSLLPGVDAANYTSHVTIYGRSVRSLNLSWNAANSTGDYDNITIMYTLDNGTTWTPSTNGQQVNVTGSENEFRWRIFMQQDVLLNNTPYLDNITIMVEYLPEILELWFKATYELDLDGEIEFQTHFSYHASGSSLIFLGYFDPDVELQVTGMSVTKGEQGDYPGKDVYRHMMGSYESCIDVRILEIDDSGSGGLPFLFWGGLVMLLIGIVGLAFVKRRPAGKSAAVDEEASARGGEGEDAAAGSEEPDNRDAGEPGERLAELEKQKEKVLQAIKRVDAELDEGVISREEHDHIKAGYKKRAVAILKEIDKYKNN